MGSEASRNPKDRDSSWMGWRASGGSMIVRSFSARMAARATPFLPYNFAPPRGTDAHVCTVERRQFSSDTVVRRAFSGLRLPSLSDAEKEKS